MGHPHSSESASRAELGSLAATAAGSASAAVGSPTAAASAAAVPAVSAAAESRSTAAASPSAAGSPPALLPAATPQSAAAVPAAGASPSPQPSAASVTTAPPCACGRPVVSVCGVGLPRAATAESIQACTPLPSPGRASRPSMHSPPPRAAHPQRAAQRRQLLPLRLRPPQRAAQRGRLLQQRLVLIQQRREQLGALAQVGDELPRRAFGFVGRRQGVCGAGRRPRADAVAAVFHGGAYTRL